MNPRLIIILGAAPCAMEDFSRIPWSAPFNFDLLAVGLDAVALTAADIQYLATYHPEDLPKCIERRRAIGGNLDYKVISHAFIPPEIRANFTVPIPEVDIVEPYEPDSGSSALLAALAAIRLGYERIVLCGCPLDVPPYIDFQKGWTKKSAAVRGPVRSMSGWTRDFLGAPTDEWLLEKSDSSIGVNLPNCANSQVTPAAPQDRHSGESRNPGPEDASAAGGPA